MMSKGGQEGVNDVGTAQPVGRPVLYDGNCVAVDVTETREGIIEDESDVCSLDRTEVTSDIDVVAVEVSICPVGKGTVVYTVTITTGIII